ncbi:MAG: hypothetical protein PHH23_01665 [Paludibacteraceae bacterium]|nr:hypothetical protein [Paludibacteraceae bacterium]
MGQRVSKTRVAELFAKKGCNIYATCEAAGISRRTFYNWLNRDKKFSQLIEDSQEALLDAAESKLISKINDGDTTSIIFFLKTKGKKRGYVEQIEQKVEVNPFLELMKSLPDE